MFDRVWNRPMNASIIQMEVIAQSRLVTVVITQYICNLVPAHFSANHRTEGEGGGHFFNSSVQLHPLHRQLDISRAITAESSPLHIGSSRTWTGNL